MTSLYDLLLPKLQSINEEGGNMVSHLISRPILEFVDTGASSDPTLGRIRSKIHEAIDAHKDKRDHDRFSAIFNFYTEAVVYLSMRERGINVRAVPENDKKSPDFATLLSPIVGFEVKTIDVHRPSETYDTVMNNGFEAQYEALEKARKAKAKSPRGVGVGTSITVQTPHGEQADLRDALTQTIRKIRGNVKAGQYSGQPTFLIVSLARLGLDQNCIQLRRWYEESSLRAWDHDDGDSMNPINGQLYAVAAHEYGNDLWGSGHPGRGRPVNYGPLNEAGILIDHPFIPGIIFMETIWNETDSCKLLKKGIRFNGVWNASWENDSQFSQEEKVEAKRCFSQLCHVFNDTLDSHSNSVPDLRKLRADLAYHENQFTRKWAGRTPDDTALQSFVVEADRLYVLWKAAELSVDPSKHIAISPTQVLMGNAEKGGYPVISYAGQSSHPDIPKLEFAKQYTVWLPSEDVGPIVPGPIQI